MNFGTLGAGFGGMGRVGGVTVPTTADVLALLAGSGGMVFDPTTITSLYKSTNTSTPVTASGDTIGRFEDLLSAVALTQGTGANQPLYDVTGSIKSIVWDGTNDILSSSVSGIGILNNKAYGTIIAAVLPTSDVSNRRAFAIPRNSASSIRMAVDKSTSDKAQVTGRRLDADGAAVKASTAAIAGSWCVICGEHDYANTVQSIQINLNAAETATPGWGAGTATSATDSAEIAMGGRNGGEFWLGKTGRMAIVAQQLSAGVKRDVIRWAAAGAEVYL